MELGSCVTRQKGLTKFPKGLCNGERKVGDGLGFVIKISGWSHMHIVSAPYNNESITIQLEDKCRKIILLDVGCKFNFAMDSEHPGKEVNLGINLMVEV